MRKSVVLQVAIFLTLLSALSAQNPVPLINQPLLPTATPPGGPQFTLTVNGTGFVAGSVVNWNGTALVTTSVNASQLTAVVPAIDIADASTAGVTVVNPAPGGGPSNVVFFPITTPTSTVQFRRSDVAVAEGSSTLATGDFNGDGKLDLAVSEYFGDEVAILLGNGDGTFQPPVEYPVGSRPTTVLTGDFNGDGILDLAVRNQQGSSTVSILLGKGDGTFYPAVNYATGSGIARMASGDFNGDGNLDLATTNNSDGTVSVLLGNGDGTFQKQVAYAAGNAPISIAVGDVNADGKLDLVLGLAGGGRFAVLLGNGDGSFQSPRTYPTVTDPESVILADFDGDGKLDLAAFNENGSGPGIEILLGNGDGTFRSFASLSAQCGATANDCTAATADINSDGKLDLIVRNSEANVVQVLLGNGNGTFQNPVTFSTGLDPEQVVVGDFNGDGRLDLAVANLGDNYVSVLLQQAPGPGVTLSTSSLDFGSHLIRTESDPQTVTLTNTGTGALDITGIVSSTDFLQNDTCASTLLAGKHCVMKVAFRPGGVGIKTGTLTISDNAPDSPQIVNLSGVSTALSLSGTSLSFGSQPVGTTSAPLTITLTNLAISRAIPINNVLIKGGNFLSFGQTNTCGTGLAAGASCTFYVTFTPRKGGNRKSTLYIWNGGGETPLEVSLTGTGTD